MGHGVWHASGRPTATLGRPLSVNGDNHKDTSVVRGDMVTVRKNGVKVRIFVEYISDDVIEGTVTKSTKQWRKGQWISAERGSIVSNREYNARITEATIDPLPPRKLRRKIKA